MPHLKLLPLLKNDTGTIVGRTESPYDISQREIGIKTLNQGKATHSIIVRGITTTD